MIQWILQRDILGIDHPKHNKEFMSELSILNKE